MSWFGRWRLPRRLLQFNLRTLLLVTTLAAVWFALQTHRVRFTRENVEGARQSTQFNQAVHGFVWSPDRLRVAFVGWETPVEIRSASGLGLQRKIDGKLIEFAFSPDPNIVACCANCNIAEVRDLASGATIAIDTKNPQPDLAFSPDGNLLATGGYGTLAKLWNVPDGSFVREFDTGATGGLCPVFSPDGKILAVGNRNSFTSLFDVSTGKLLARLSKASTQEIRFDPTGRRLAVAYVDGTISLWDVASGKELLSLESGAEEIYTLDWSPDGQLLAAAGLNGDILVFDGSNLEVLKRIDGPEWVASVKFAPEGSRLFSAGGEREFRGKRWVEVWRAAPDTTEKVLTIVLWGMIAILVAALILRSLRALSAHRRMRTEAKLQADVALSLPS